MALNSKRAGSYFLGISLASWPVSSVMFVPASSNLPPPMTSPWTPRSQSQTHLAENDQSNSSTPPPDVTRSKSTRPEETDENDVTGPPAAFATKLSSQHRWEEAKRHAEAKVGPFLPDWMNPAMTLRTSLSVRLTGRRLWRERMTPDPDGSAPFFLLLCFRMAEAL